MLCCSFTPFLFDVFCIPSGLFTDSANSEIAGAAAALSYDTLIRYLPDTR